ncbi:MAG: CHRD domain-containing protein [Acidobacteriota bacterium]|nr:CHRD domain-containing protein [Acidobacteriota bacterium]
MRAKSISLLLAPLLALLLASSARAQPIEVLSLLGGGDVVPDKVLTGAFGVAILTVNEQTSEIAFDVDVFNLASGVSGAHIHVGAPGVGGPVLFDFRPAQRQAGDLNMSGTLSAASLTTHADLGIRDIGDALQSIIGLTTYIDVHTDAKPEGEIRGALVISFSDSLAAEVQRTLLGRGGRLPR